MIQLSFCDEKFEQSGLWKQARDDGHFHQRFLQRESLIYCETIMKVHGARQIDCAVDLIRAPWDWWTHGSVSDFVTHEDGSIEQTLAPVWWFITRMGLRIFPAIELPLLGGKRVPILLSKDFAGVSTMDVYLDNDVDTMIIRGRYHGIHSQVPFVPDKLAEYLHMDAESGTMPAPFPKGTGWVGLLARLEPAGSRCRKALADIL